MLQDRARETDLERSVLRVRLVAIALGATMLALTPDRAQWLVGVVPVTYALAASLFRFAVPRYPARWLPLASVAADLVYATVFVALVPLDRPTWALYVFAIGVAALRFGSRGAFFATALALAGYAGALAVRLGEVRASELLSLQVLLAFGLLCAELTWVIVRSAAERRELRSFVLAQRELVSASDSAELLQRVVDHTVLTLGASGAWVRDRLAPGHGLGPSRGRAPVTVDQVMDGAIELPLDPPRTSLFVVFDGTAPASALASVRDLASQAAPLLLAARQRHDLERSRDQLRALADHLGAEVRKRDDRFASVAHELRNPLTSVKGYGQLMSRNLQAALDQLTQLDRLIGDLQELPAGPTLDLTHVELLDAARDGARRLKLAGDHEVTVLRGDDGPFVVRADAGRIAQVLDNLLGNAAKYSPVASPITVRVTHDHDEVRVAVTDQGAGLAKADLDRVFERYERGSAQTGAPGQGIGLAVARELVEAHGGRIWATSDGPRLGSTFWIALPATVPLPEHPEPEGSVPEQEDTPSRS